MRLNPPFLIRKFAYLAGQIAGDDRKQLLKWVVQEILPTAAGSAVLDQLQLYDETVANCDGV
jgi:hypothetical protein